RYQADVKGTGWQSGVPSAAARDLERLDRARRPGLAARGDAMSYRLISVVLPVHNQADHLADIVNGFESALEGIAAAHEFLLVPNGCRDGSAEICCALARFYSSVRVVHADHAGWGLAVRVGLAHARGDLLCFTNSARTSPRELNLLLLTACANPHVVI